MTIADTIFDTINDNWGSGGYAGVTPAIDCIETQTQTDLGTADVIEVRSYSLKGNPEGVNDKYENQFFSIDVYVSSKTSAAQLKLLVDEVEYLLKNTVMTDLQIDSKRRIQRDYSVSQWSFGKHAVILKVHLVSLLVDGAITPAAGVTASMQALLMYTSANAAWVPMNYAGTASGNDTRIYISGTNYSNSGATDEQMIFDLGGTPHIKSTLKLYISGLRVHVADADADDYVDIALLVATDYTGNLQLLNDSTNRTAAGDYTYSFAAVDVSTYDSIRLRLYLFCTNAGEIDISSVEVQCYYDT